MFQKTIRINELMSSPLNQIQKSLPGCYRPERNKKSKKGNFSYSSEIKEFYNDHSNAMLIAVDGDQVDYEIFSTRRLRRREKVGSLQA